MTSERARRGKEIRDKSLGKEGIDRLERMRKLSPTHAEAILEYVFGTIWDRPLLDPKTRELLTIAATAAQDLSGEVGQHVRGALNRGASQEEVVEVILHCAPYIGFPKTNHALKAAADIFERWDEMAEEWRSR